MTLIQSKKIIENVIISSFNPFVIRKIKNINKKIFTSLIWTNTSSPFLINSPFWIYFCKPDGFHIDSSFSNQKLIQWGKKFGLIIILFTINQHREFVKAIQIGADGIFTDDPYINSKNFNKNNSNIRKHTI